MNIALVTSKLPAKDFEQLSKRYDIVRKIELVELDRNIVDYQYEGKRCREKYSAITSYWSEESQFSYPVLLIDRPSDFKITLDLNQCPHLEFFLKGYSVSRALNNAVAVIEDPPTDNVGRLNVAVDELEELAEPLDWLHKAVTEQLRSNYPNL